MPKFDLTLVDATLVTRTFSIKEGISQLFELSIVGLSHDANIDLEAVVGQPAEFKALSGTTHLVGKTRHWKGVVSYIEQIAIEDISETGQSTYSLVLVPEMWLLTQRQGYRIFQHLTVPQIVDKILEEWEIKHAWVLTGSYEPLEYKVQYGETDYAFLCRLLEEEGIAFTFPDGGAGSLLTFGDDLPSGEVYAEALKFVDEPNRSAQMEFVTEVQLSHGVRPGAVVIRDQDFRKPGYALLGKAPPAAGKEGKYEQYHYQPGAFVVDGGSGGGTPVADDKSVARHKEAVGTALATRRLIAQRRGKRQITFASNVFGLRPGMIFDMVDHPQSELGPGNPLLVTEVEISGGHGVPWSTTAWAVFGKDKYRPPFNTPKPEVKGVQSATVVGPPGEEIYVDEFGRARVQFPWDREGKNDDDSSCWMRVSQGWAGAGFGALNLPRVGEEVLVGFLGGDPDQPIIVGRVFNATRPVPYKLPDHKSRSTWKSSTYPGGVGFNEIMFDDASGSELVYAQAQKDRRQLVKNDELITIGNDRQKLVKGDQAEETRGSHRVLVGGGQDIVIKAAKKELIEADSHLHVKGDRIGKVAGDDSLVADGEIHVKAGTALVIEGTADLTIKGPGGFIRIDAMGVTIVGLLVNINSGGTPGVATARSVPEDAALATPDEVVGSEGLPVKAAVPTVPTQPENVV